MLRCSSLNRTPYSTLAKQEYFGFLMVIGLSILWDPSTNVY